MNSKSQTQTTLQAKAHRAFQFAARCAVWDRCTHYVIHDDLGRIRVLSERHPDIIAMTDFFVSDYLGYATPDGVIHQTQMLKETEAV